MMTLEIHNSLLYNYIIIHTHACFQTAGIESMAGVDDEAEEVLAEFDFLVSETGEGAGEAQSHGDGPEWGRWNTCPSEDVHNIVCR